ncbi:hypothetical protein [Anoxybacteroides tepidamans]|uniref:hypothetical protein n=1 Tax=Anoxybacteroides tepidamans TaxID=265948 RepID=UPI0018DB4A7A|nr:hypothetical protein [Anoxybacillus tepidamans]
MKQLGMDWIKISQALENTYMLLEQQEMQSEELQQIEMAKHEWKQAFTYALSDVFRA